MAYVSFKNLSQRTMDFLDFTVNRENQDANIFKKFVVSNSMSEETRKSITPVVTTSDITYVTCTVPKDIVNNCPSFRSILPAINTPTSRLTIFFQSFSKYFDTELQNIQKQNFYGKFNSSSF